MGTQGVPIKSIESHPSKVGSTATRPRGRVAPLRRALCRRSPGSFSASLVLEGRNEARGRASEASADLRCFCVWLYSHTKQRFSIFAGTTASLSPDFHRWRRTTNASTIAGARTSTSYSGCLKDGVSQPQAARASRLFSYSVVNSRTIPAGTKGCQGSAPETASYISSLGAGAGTPPFSTAERKA